MRAGFFVGFLFFVVFVQTSFAQDLFFIDRGDTVRLTPPRTLRSGERLHENEWFTMSNGQRVKIDEGIIVELRNGVDAGDVFIYYDIWRYERLAENLFLVIPREESAQFEMSRELLRNPAVVNSHPNLIRERRSR